MLLTDREGHGEGLIAWHLLCRLAARGHDLVVCTREARLTTDPPFELIITGRASRFESIEPLAYLRRTREIYRRTSGNGAFDVAHWLFPQGATETLFLPPRGLPFVIGPQSTQWPAGGRRRPLAAGDLARLALQPVFGRARNRTFAAASVVMGDTPEALAGVPPTKGRVVPQGIDIQGYQISDIPAQPSILFIGSLSEAKGLRELVDAFVQVRLRLPEARLVIAGDGPERTWIEQRREELRLGTALTLVGRVAHARVPELLRDASLLCLPSHHEPFGMVVLEAMASGRAVVATNAGGPKHIIDPLRGGRLVPVRSVAHLTEALVELLQDRSALVAAGRFNRGRAATVFTLDRVVDDVERAYADAIGATQ